MRLLLLLTIFTFLNSNVIFAKNDKYRAIWNDDPATTMTIGWNQISGTKSTVYYDTKDHQKNVDAYAFFKKVDRIEAFREMNNHFARLKGLLPNTKYYFVIKDSKGVSERFWFKTAPNNSSERLSIIAGGDSRNHRKGRQNANRLVAKLRPHCVMFGGDMTSSDNAPQWINWMDDWQLTITKDKQLIPIIPARGNHEYSNGTIMKLFDAPNQHIYYGLTMGGNLLRTYTLNSLIAPGGDQRDWLRQDLRENQHIIWRIGQYHHPIRPHTARKSDKQHQYNNWANLFYEFQVQLVVESDAHVCKTTYPIRPTYKGNHDMGFIRDDASGTVYVGEGCWGAPIRPNNDDKKWTRASGSFNQIKWIFVDTEKIEVRTIKTDNALEVGSLAESNIFKTPKNLNLWKPKTGTVITINRKNDETIKEEIAKKVQTSSKAISSKKKTSTASKEKEVTQKITQPLILTDFKVENSKEDIQISWNTISCPKRVKCQIQRSETGMENSFETIKTLDLEHSAAFKSYVVKDTTVEKVQSPFAYYRIKSIYSNGTTQYSEEEISLIQAWSKFSQASKVDGWSYVLKYDLPIAGDVTITIFDAKGNQVNQEVYPNQIAGKHNRRVDSMFYRNGKYLIRISSNKDFISYQWFEKE